MFTTGLMKSFQGRAIAVVAAIFAVSFVIVIGVQGVRERSDAIDRVVENKRVETRLLASAMAGALRWQNVALFDRVHETLALDDVADLLAVVAVDRGGETVYEWQREGAANLLPGRLLSGSVSLSAGTEAALADHYAVVSAPSAYYQAEHNSVVPAGHVLVYWDFRQVESDLLAAWQRSMLLSGAILVASVILLVILFRRLVSTPLSRIITQLVELARAHGNVTVTNSSDENEFVQMAHAVRVFRDAIVEKHRIETEQEQMETDLREEKRRTMERLARHFDASVKAIVTNVSTASTQLQETARSMSSNADHNNQRSTAVATASEQSSMNVKMAATATEQLSGSVKEISRKIADSNQVAARASDAAKDIDVTVQDLAHAADKISQIVDFISEVARKINLLALNAAIEAARAGAAGKGFAVVAQEVKNLAMQTANATGEIAMQVDEVQAATGRTVDATQGILEIIERITENSQMIAAAIEEQDSSTQQIARSVQEAAVGTEIVSRSIEEVRKVAGETGMSAAQLLEAARSLSGQSSELDREIEEFLEGLRLTAKRNREWEGDAGRQGLMAG